MKFTLSFLMILANCFTFAQGYQIADSSKRWSTLHAGVVAGGVVCCAKTYFHKFTQISPGDQYLNILESEDSLQSWNNLGLIREDTLTKRVYFTSSYGTPEGMVYNFDIQEGDTVQVENQMINATYTQPMVCDSIDMVIVDGELKKRFFFHISGYDPDYICDIWVEGLGSLHGVLNSSLFASGFSGGRRDLLCCLQDDNTIWMNSYSDCYIDALYPQFISQNYDTAYLNRYYEFHVDIDTGDATFFHLIPYIPQGFTFDSITGILSGTPTQLGQFGCVFELKNLQYNFLTDRLGGYINVVLPTGSTNINPENINIYPNPFTTSLSIEGLAGNASYILELYTPQGRLIKQCNFNSTARADLSELRAGLFLLKVKDYNGHLVLSERVVKL